MRIWSIHPKYLDKIWLVAGWRETLLAKNVLEWNTKWYKNHPQLERFKKLDNPLFWINKYLQELYNEASFRWYKFDKNKFEKIDKNIKIKITSGQIKYEFEHLLKKLEIRDKAKFELIKNIKNIEVCDIFEVVPWEIEIWEKIN